jgi:aspartate/methionine/tyrosine aminotransferase
MTLGNQGWTLDLDHLAAAITPRTKAIFINSPCNPTGWTATREELAAILALARARGLWIVADEIYSRFYYSGSGVSPSFRDVAEDDDAILYVNTMSKNWAMTGWRVGWLETPPALGQVAENMIQYSTSGVAQFMQKAALVALDQGDAFIGHQVDRARRSRDIVCDALAATGRVRFARPDGAFYLFFAVDGEPDTRKLALRLVDEANIGLAPGTAFGIGGAAYLRMCFAKSPEAMTEAASRLVTWLKTH